MKVDVIKSEGLAHNSYLLVSDGEAAVIDPRRDCAIYAEQASRSCAKIKYILETHRNEDYVIGSLELQNMTEAEIAHSKEYPSSTANTTSATATPSTLETQKSKPSTHQDTPTNPSATSRLRIQSQKRFSTGDTLFSGSVGRTDLYGKQAHRIQAEKLYDSLHEKILVLDGGVLVYTCSWSGKRLRRRNQSGDLTTIGYEKRINPYLQLDKEGFIQKSLDTELVVPRYFKQIEEVNLNGPQLLSDLALPKPYQLLEFKEEMQEQNMVVVDTRTIVCFCRCAYP
jgi:hydroxyacylglutathione hydrolase